MTASFEEEYGVEQSEALKTLDTELRVVGASGKIMCCLGFMATFYVRRIDHPDLRERLVAAYELYRDGIGDRLIWGADPKTNRPRKLAGTNIADVRAWSKKLGPGDDFDFSFHGGVDKDDADPRVSSAFVSRDDPSKLSFITFGWPLSWVAERSSKAFAQQVCDLAVIVGPTHGYAGWSITTHVTDSGSCAAMGAVAAFAQRFRGLEVDQPIDHSILLKKNQAIKGSNWLTILGAPWVEKLGGVAKLEAALGPGIGVSSFGEGIVIQAGPRPLRGDVNRGEKMEAYHRVAQVLRPIRVDRLDAFSSDYYHFGAEQTAKWLARFDTP
jgi:hypothetical protein